jgi:hypothetical protein
MLAAQARIESALLITDDPAFEPLGALTIW